MDAVPSAAVLAAHTSFYTALSLADLALMERLWLPSPAAVCVHPGWPALLGWDAIHASWVRIFENQGPLHIWPTEVQLRLHGQTAEVNCLENIDMRQMRDNAVLQNLAINVFRLASGAWRLLEHHTLPAPPSGSRPPERFSDN
ncbi:MAG: nuclear transport factor 2 family protein [Anaerolineales bacterium]|nr:nuclear transport factor 2 family protein [Anaerolineales bacterium]